MVIFVTSKNEEDPIKIEGARVATIQNIDFSDTKGQLTPQSEVGSSRNSNSSETLFIQDVIVILVTSKNEEDPIKIKVARVPTALNIDFSDTQGQLTPQ